MLKIDNFGQFIIKSTVFLPSKCFLRMNIRGQASVCAYDKNMKNLIVPSSH